MYIDRRVNIWIIDDDDVTGNRCLIGKRFLLTFLHCILFVENKERKIELIKRKNQTFKGKDYEGLQKFILDTRTVAIILVGYS